MSQTNAHNRKKKMARKMLTRSEIKTVGAKRYGLDIFTSEGWKKRADAKIKKVQRKIAKQKEIKKNKIHV